jgi:hypothetical protein
VNYTPRTADGAALQYDTHLDYFVTDSALDCHRDHLDLGAAHVKVLTMSLNSRWTCLVAGTLDRSRSHLW